MTGTEQKQQQGVIKASNSSLLAAVTSLFNPWNNVVSLAQRACFTTLAGMKVGHVRIILMRPGSNTVHATYDYGDMTSKLTATVKVLKDAFWPRLMIYGAMGFGEAYMYNEIEMFACFLDPTMTYSLPDLENNDFANESLEEAQISKIHSILDMAAIREGDHVLEIGTGWGALAIEAVRRHKCRVTTLTLSKEQKALAEGRIAAAGLTSSITVLLQDYRTLDPKSTRLTVSSPLKCWKPSDPNFSPSFSVKRTLSSTRNVVSLRFREERGRLIVDHMINIGPHYAKALRMWREKFSENFDKVVEETPDMAHVYTQEFKRKWEFYFAYCESGLCIQNPW
ncbi:S-adenosyl-L-methionine-dependent methyltransferase [Chytridium lagenaria]|nr:S-adenosyl-L-methionine-dependent methyltransferase [Chytridium lagenaria]